MALTRFFDRISGKDGPVSGALFVVPLHVTLATNSVFHQRVQLPAGARISVTDVTVHSGTVAAACTLRIGTTVNGTQVLADTAVATNTGALTTLKTQEIPAGGFWSVRVTTSATGTVDNASIVITGHLSAPPTSVPAR